MDWKLQWFTRKLFKLCISRQGSQFKESKKKIYEHFKLEKKKAGKNKEEAEFHLFIFCEKPDDIESVSDINMNFPSLYP